MLVPKLREKRVNNIASLYCTENYDKLVAMARAQARKMYGNAVHVDAEDCVQDVVEAILQRERVGNGYDVDGEITVEGYIFGYISKYLKNKKYAFLPSVKKGDYTYSVKSLESLDDSTDDDEHYDATFRKKVAEIAMSDDFTLKVINSAEIRDSVREILSFEKEHKIKIRKVIFGEYDIDNNSGIIKSLLQNNNKLIEAIKALMGLDPEQVSKVFEEMDNTSDTDSWILDY